MSSSQLRQLREDDADAVAALFAEAWGESRRMDGAGDPRVVQQPGLSRRTCSCWSRTAASSAYFDVSPKTTSRLDLVDAPVLWDDAVRPRREPRGCDRVRNACARSFADGHRWCAGRAPRATADPQLVDDGDRARRGGSAEPAIPEGIELSAVPPSEDERRSYEALQEAFLDHWDCIRAIENWREFIVKARNFDRIVWLWPGPTTKLAGVSLNYPERQRRPGTAGSGRSACAGLAPRAGSARRFCAARSASCTPAGCARCASASTPRTRPARRACTSASACACCAVEHLGGARRAGSGAECERLARRVPRLPDADGGRDRARVPVPRLRPRVRGGARAGAARLGRAAARRWRKRPRMRAPVARGGDRRRGDARRADRRAARRRCRSGRSCSAGAAARTSAPSRARAPPRPGRGRLDRRARRPEHARELAVRATSGGCRCGC